MAALHDGTNTADDDATDSVVRSFLDSAGLKENRFDPSSLEALRDLLHHGSTPSMEMTKPSATTTSTSSAVIGDAPSEDRSSSSDRNVVAVSLPAIDIPDDASPTERLILQQLQQQTALLLDLQAQLQAHIKEQTKNGNRQAASRTTRGVPNNGEAATAAPVAVEPPAAAAANNNNPSLPWNERFVHLWEGVEVLGGGPPNRILGGMSIWTIVKALLMVMILLQRSKLPTSASMDSSSSHTGWMVIGGFIVCGGIFVYLTWDAWSIGLEYGARVLVDGERIDWNAEKQQRLPPPPTEQQQQRQANEQNDNAVGWWHAGQEQQPGGGVWKGVVDVLVLLGSFVCSIFPMWEPPQPLPPPPVVEEAVEDNDPAATMVEPQEDDELAEQEQIDEPEEAPQLPPPP